MAIMLARTAVVLVLATHSLTTAVPTPPLSARPLTLVRSAGPTAGQRMPQARILPQPAPPAQRSVLGPDRDARSIEGPAETGTAFFLVPTQGPKPR